MAEARSMKLGTMVFVAASLGNIWAAPGRTVTVCIEHAGDKAIASSMHRASEIFAGIGVEIEWHSQSSCPEPLPAIKISFDFFTRAEIHPGALAYACPFEGTHIEVFYNHVQHIRRSMGAESLLAYVLVHEITHILQAVSEHSEQGIMKAEDYAAMEERKLSFMPLDVMMIYTGLDARTRKTGEKVVEATAR
jgi:hypothetical protein